LRRLKAIAGSPVEMQVRRSQKAAAQIGKLFLRRSLA